MGKAGRQSPAKAVHEKSNSGWRPSPPQDPASRRIEEFRASVEQVLARCEALLPDVQRCAANEAEAAPLIDQRLRLRSEARRDKKAEKKIAGLTKRIDQLYKPIPGVRRAAGQLLYDFWALIDSAPCHPERFTILTEGIRDSRISKDLSSISPMTAVSQDFEIVLVKLHDLLCAYAPNDREAASDPESTGSEVLEEAAPLRQPPSFDRAKLRWAREQHYHTREKAAECLRVTPSAVARWEQGSVRNPHPEHLEAIKAYISEAENLAKQK